MHRRSSAVRRMKIPILEIASIVIRNHHITGPSAIGSRNSEWDGKSQKRKPKLVGRLDETFISLTDSEDFSKSDGC